MTTSNTATLTLAPEKLQSPDTNGSSRILGRICLVDSNAPEHWRPLKEHLAETCASDDWVVSDLRLRPVRSSLADDVPLCGSNWLRDSYRAFQRLRHENHAVIVFDARGGMAYYSLLAKRQGLAFANTTLCVYAHDTSLRMRTESGQLLEKTDDLERDDLERKSASLADLFVASNVELAEWCADHHWPLPSIIAPTSLADFAAPAVLKSALAGWKPLSLPEKRSPLVSVCLTHYNRPYLLQQAIRSLMQQDYANFEVVLVDDGSTHPRVPQVLDFLEPRFRERGWKILREPNRYLGAARNRAATVAEGDYLLFMDDDNVAKPHEISTFVQAAQRTGADLLFCLFDRFEGRGAPTSTTPFHRHLFSGMKTPVGLLRNSFGDANSLIRRDRFWEIGGFTEDVGVAHEDWELFAKSALAGLRLELVPESLFWYRSQPKSMSDTVDPQQCLKRSLRPFQAITPTFLQPLLELAVSQAARVEALQAERRELRGRVKSLEKHARQLEFQLARRNLHLAQARYRLADRINEVLKRLPLVQPLIRRLLRDRTSTPSG